MEKWKDVIGYEGIYEVSDLGNIRKFKTKRLRKIWKHNKYPHILLSNNKRKKTVRVHRLVAKAFLPQISGKTHVNHINGIKTDNRVVNLEWVSQSENNRHSYKVLGNVSPMLRKKYKPFKHPSSLVTSIDQVKKFDRLNKRGIGTEKIGEMVGINGSSIRKHLRKLRSGAYDKLESNF